MVLDFVKIILTFLKDKFKIPYTRVQCPNNSMGNTQLI